MVPLLATIPMTSIDDQSINKIKEMVLGNRRLTFRELVDMVGISFGSNRIWRFTKAVYKQIFTGDESWIF